jgi:uncharacterized zinc-type alcohol dehydrogenase-like protein
VNLVTLPDVYHKRENIMTDTKGYAAQSAKSPVAPWNFKRREVKSRDVQIDILYCGICHSDLHQIRNE